MDILGKVLDKHYEGKWNSFHAPTGTMADFENIDWIEDAPSKSDFQAQYDAEEQAYNNSQYQRDRLQGYPNTNDLIVALWEKVIEGRSESADALEVKRQEVKTAHPKPE